MSESFLVVFNSQGSNVISNANRNSITYNVNWGAFLPKKFKKFHCQFVFKSANLSSVNGTILTDNGFVNMTLGKVNVYDGNTMTSNLGIVYPVVLNYTATICNSFYNSTNNDNNDFWISYPATQQVTLNLNTFAGTPIGNMPHYVLYLSLIGLTDDQLDLKH